MIFITQKDVLGHNLPIYHIRRKIQEVSEDFKDGAHIIYVNSAIEDETELGRLIHDLHCKNADDMHSEVLARRVRELKETQKGVDRMSEVLDNLFHQMYNEKLKIVEQQAMERGELKAKKEAALSLAGIGLTIEQIAQALKENVTTIQEWLSENLASSK